MLTAPQVQTLISLTAEELTQAIRRSGYKKDTLHNTEFVGLTNGNQFAYKAYWIDDGEGKLCKVFATFDSAGYLVADY